jgi:HSP20 family protein
MFCTECPQAALEVRPLTGVSVALETLSTDRRKPISARRSANIRRAQMTVVRYEPFRLLNRFHRDFGRFFDDTGVSAEVANTAAAAWLPSVDVREEKERFLVTVDLPGVDKKDIEIVAEKGVLTIKGERHAETKSGDASFEPSYGRVERVTGRFLRRFTLPETAQADAITAKQTNGVLEVSIPKQPQVQPKRVEVQAA